MKEVKKIRLIAKSVVDMLQEEGISFNGDSPEDLVLLSVYHFWRIAKKEGNTTLVKALLKNSPPETFGSFIVIN